jgi:hypothetical protein
MEVTIFGVLAFEDIYELGGDPKYALKHSATVQVAKDAPCLQDLFAGMEEVARKTWPGDWEQKLANIHDDIIRGVDPSDSKVSISDGDLVKSDYNAGFYVVKPSRRANQGPPAVYDLAAKPVFAADLGRDQAGNLIVPPGAPAEGYGVAVLITIWAQAARNRINFTVEAVRAVQAGVKAIGPSPEQSQARAVAWAGGLQLPESIPGVHGEAAQVPAQASQPAAPPQAAGPRSFGVPGATAVPQSGPPAASLGLPVAPEADEPAQGGGLLKL